jgi:hypothetical protein
MNQVDLDQLAVAIGRAIAKHRVASGFTQEQVAEIVERLTGRLAKR